MSYNLSLSCGCVVYVSCHPRTRVAHTRVIEKRGARCGVRRHAVGMRLYLWELLPPPMHDAPVEWTQPGEWRTAVGGGAKPSN
jgi:hypothetical protein